MNQYVDTTGTTTSSGNLLIHIPQGKHIVSTQHLNANISGGVIYIPWANVDGGWFVKALSVDLAFSVITETEVTVRCFYS